MFALSDFQVTTNEQPGRKESDVGVPFFSRLDHVSVRRNSNLMVEDVGYHFAPGKISAAMQEKPGQREFVSEVFLALIGTGTMDVEYPRATGAKSKDGWPMGRQRFPFSSDCSFTFFVGNQEVERLGGEELWGKDVFAIHWKREVFLEKGGTGATYLCEFSKDQGNIASPVLGSLYRFCLQDNNLIPPLLMTYPPSFTVFQNQPKVGEGSGPFSPTAWNFRRIYPAPGYFYGWYMAAKGYPRSVESPAEKIQTPLTSHNSETWQAALTKENIHLVNNTLKQLQGAKNTWIIRNDVANNAVPKWDHILPLLGIADYGDLPRPGNGDYILGSLDEKVRYEIPPSTTK